MEWQKSLGRVQRVRRTSYRSNPYTMSTTCEVWINLLNTKHALRKQQLSGSTTRSKSHFTAKSLNVQSLLYALQLQREPARLDFRCIKDSSCLGSFPVFDFTNPEKGKEKEKSALVAVKGFNIHGVILVVKYIQSYSWH